MHSRRRVDRGSYGGRLKVIVPEAEWAEPRCWARFTADEGNVPIDCRSIDGPPMACQWSSALSMVCSRSTTGPLPVRQGLRFLLPFLGSAFYKSSSVGWSVVRCRAGNVSQQYPVTMSPNQYAVTLLSRQYAVMLSPRQYAVTQP